MASSGGEGEEDGVRANRGARRVCRGGASAAVAGWRWFGGPATTRRAAARPEPDADR